MIGAAVRALLEGVVDYAGLFPPAALDMRAAVANYARYLSSEDVWALGRFVAPAARLEEFADARRALPASGAAEWRLSAILVGATAPALDQVRRFNRSHAGSATVDVVETRLESPQAIAAAAALARGLQLYVEVPVHEDPRELVAAIRDAGARAKLRTGGVSADAFPSPAEVARFMRRCRELGVAFKATAGLHHPLRGSYPLTYERDAACATMHGFLNVLLAAALVYADADDSRVLAVLEATATDVLRVDRDAVTVAGVRLGAAELRRVRETAMVSFGSCSFREPLDELRAAGLL